MEEQNTHGQTTPNIPITEVGEYPMTAGHHEIQALKEAAKEIEKAISNLKDIINDLPSPISEDEKNLLRNKLDFVITRIQQSPNRLTSFWVTLKAELEATKKDRREAAELLRRAKERMEAVIARENELIKDAEALDYKKLLANAGMKGALDTLWYVEDREWQVERRERRVGNQEDREAFEKLLGVRAHGTGKTEGETEADNAVAGRSARPTIGLNPIPAAAAAREPVADRENGAEKSEEERALEELNLGAAAVREDAAEAAAAEARHIERLGRSINRGVPHLVANATVTSTDLNNRLRRALMDAIALVRLREGRRGEEEGEGENEDQDEGEDEGGVDIESV